jgi:hypothetical protein
MAIGGVVGGLAIAHKSVGVGLSANPIQQNHLQIKTHPYGLPMNRLISWFWAIDNFNESAVGRVFIWG